MEMRLRCPSSEATRTTPPSGISTCSAVKTRSCAQEIQSAKSPLTIVDRQLVNSASPSLDHSVPRLESIHRVRLPFPFSPNPSLLLLLPTVFHHSTAIKSIFWLLSTARHGMTIASAQVYWRMHWLSDTLSNFHERQEKIG